MAVDSKGKIERKAKKGKKMKGSPHSRQADFVSRRPKHAMKQPLVKHHEGQKWFDYQVNEELRDPSKESLRAEELKALEEEADNILKNDVELYNQYVQSQGGSEASWLLSVIKKGTASDRMTAMQLQMYTSPVHSLLYMEVMIGSLERRNTREASEILPILEELFLNHFLPVNRKLISFSGRPLKSIGNLCSKSENGRKRLLILWRFEHKLKLLYERFIRAVEGLASMMVEDLSKRALRTALNLLAERPEGEKFLLSMLVNKLGHPKPRIGAYVASLLENLTKRQPKMRFVIVAEVERLIYRTNVSPKAHLYASTFLSQIVLQRGDSHLAIKMLSIYFGLFKTLVNRNVQDNHLIGILLSAANRALPYAKERAEDLVDDVDTLYKIVHTSSYPVSLQTLKLLFQVHQINDSLSDRFYSALYRKLLFEIPSSCYNQLLLLLFKALKSDSSDSRVRSIVKRLLQVATCAPPSLAAGILILISRLLETKKSIIVLQKQSDRIAAELLKPGTHYDEDEQYFDVTVDGKSIDKDAVKVEGKRDGFKEEEGVDDSLGTNHVSKPGWIHRRNTGSHSASPYNSAARNPLFVDCGSHVDSELLVLSKHYHPSVAVFAKALIQDGYINYKGDPLEDFTSLKFLDRFAFKNPKEGRQKGLNDERVPRKKQFDPWGVKKLRVSSKEYINKKANELPPDEHYLHRFASLRFKPEDDVKKNKDDWEVESVDSAEFDAFLDKFEPGAKSDDFHADYTKEFTAEKKKSKAVKRPLDEEEEGKDGDLNVDWDDDDANWEEEDEDEAGSDVADDSELMEDEEAELDSESEEDERSHVRKARMDDVVNDDSDDEMGGDDADKAGEKFAAILEDFDEEGEHHNKKGKRKWRKSKTRNKKRR